MSCNKSDQNLKNKEQQNSINLIDTLKINGNSSLISPLDSIANIIVDTMTLEGKRQKIMNNFIIEFMNSPDYDTLLDLNYDGHKDYVIGYYGKSGTGIKNRNDVYLYAPKVNSYSKDEQLSDLPNPTFYIKEKKITGFYIGNGGGGGEKLEWLKNKWTKTKEFEVDFDDVNRDRTEWRIKYPITNKTEVIIGPFQMIPPVDVLETDIKLE